MAEFGFSAKVGADVSGFQKGMQKAEKSLKKFADGISNIGKKGIVGSLANVSLAMGGVVTAFRTATKVVKDVAKAVGECTEAYKQQAIVERTLQTAIQNNPYVTGEALSNLKQFASDMQRISNVGDEQIMQLETQLISLGRTEEETMNIIRVAMDMSATGTMTLDTAITQLNATLNGNIGRLGQQNAELKGLTEEELRSGKAVEILGEKFKGLSQATVDTSTQLKNIKGDFKEAIGEFTLPSSDMWNKFWMGFYEKGIDVVHRLQASLDSSRGEGIYEKLAESVKKIKDEEQKRWVIEESLTNSNTIELNQLQTYLEGIKKRNKQEEMTLELVKQTLQYRKDAEEAVEKGRKLEEQDEARRQAELNAQKEKEDEIVKLKEEYLKKVAEQERKWQNIKTVTGEEVKAEEKIKFYQDGLVDLMTQAGDKITTNNQLYKDQLKIIEQLQSTISPEEQGTSNTWVEKIRQQAIERLQAEKDAYDETVDLEKTTALERYLVRKDYNEKIFALQKEQLLVERERAMESIKGVKNEAEEKLRINEFYNNELEKLSQSYSNTLEMEGTEAGKSFAEGFGAVLTGIKFVMSKAITLIKNMVKSIKPMLTKIFSFNIDDALDNLLVFEDKILTFFVETLPQLPSFLASALQSVSVLIQSIASSGGFMNLANILISMVDTLMTEVPKIAKALYPVLENLISTLFNVLMSNVPSVIRMITTVVKKIAQKLPQVIKVILPAIIQIVNEIIKAIPSIMTTVLPALLQAVLEMIKALMQNLPTIIQTIVEFLPQLIFGVVNAIADFIANLKAEDFVAIVGGVIKAIATLGVSLVKAIPQILEGLWELAKGLIKGMWNLILEALKATWKGLKWVLDLVVDWFKSTFGGYATGTNNAQKGLALVGEKGPELVDFKGGEKVYNATNTQRMLAGATSGNAGNTFNVTFNNLQDTSAYAMMSQLRAYNRQMAINGVI